MIQKQITTEKWINTYQPIETSGEDEYYLSHDALQALSAAGDLQQNKHLWTLVDSEPYPVWVSGFHYVNRLEHCLTKLPVEDGVDVDVIDPEDMEDQCDE